MSAPPVYDVPPPAGGRVLVVDPDADTVASLGLMLEMTGFHVRGFQNGADALSAADDFHPHVVVTDLSLPGLDGHGLIARLHARPAADRPAVVVVTGWADPATRDRLSRAGVGAVLLKPAEPDRLTELLRVLCGECVVAH